MSRFRYAEQDDRIIDVTYGMSSQSIEIAQLTVLRANMNPEKCHCHGGGWWLSPFDTWEKCIAHAAAAKGHPEDDWHDESTDAAATFGCNTPSGDDQPVSDKEARNWRNFVDAAMASDDSDDVPF